VTGLAEIQPAEWDELLAGLGCADAYFLRGYIESGRVLEGGEPIFLRLSEAGGEVVFTGLVREHGDVRDLITPYGYGAPVGVGLQPPVERFYELYDAWCKEHRIVTSFVRFHPLLGNHRQAPDDPLVRVEVLGTTVGWRLDLHDDLMEGLHPKHRNKVRKARRAGVEVTAQAAPTDLGDFVELHEETMRRQEASDFYFFSNEYWTSLQALGERLVRFDARLDGELVASALCLATKPWLHYHLSATDDRARETAAANLVVFEAGAWAKERGFTRFHLGAGVGWSTGSLFEFKQRFDPDGLCEGAIGKFVHDPDRYAALGGDPGDLTGFFPAYRR
jgi:serine/alanine adding enzyme